MFRRHWILGSLFSALVAGSLLPNFVVVPFFPVVADTAATLAAVVGIRPLDAVRLLTILMALHYALELPSLLAKALGTCRRRPNWRAKLLWCAGIGLPNLTMRVMVPVAFYLMVKGGHEGVSNLASVIA